MSVYISGVPFSCFFMPPIGPHITWSVWFFSFSFSSFFFDRNYATSPFFDINHATSPKLYWSCYPHQSRDSLSQVCGIFLVINMLCLLIVLYQDPWVPKNLERTPFYLSFTQQVVSGLEKSWTLWLHGLKTNKIHQRMMVDPMFMVV